MEQPAESMQPFLRPNPPTVPAWRAPRLGQTGVFLRWPNDPEPRACIVTRIREVDVVDVSVFLAPDDYLPSWDLELSSGSGRLVHRREVRPVEPGAQHTWPGGMVELVV